MKPLFFLIFIAFSRILTAQICPIDGQMTILKGNYIGDTLCTIDVQVSFKNISFEQIYLLNDPSLCHINGRKNFDILMKKTTGCIDTIGLQKSIDGLSFFIVDSLGNDIHYDHKLPISELCMEIFPNYLLEEDGDQVKGFDAITISRALGLPLKHIYEPFVWRFFRNYLRIKPMLPFQTSSIVYSFKVKSYAAVLKSKTKYYLHAIYHADTIAKELNEYIKPQLEFEVLSVVYKFEPIMFSLPGIKTK